MGKPAALPTASPKMLMETERRVLQQVAVGGLAVVGEHFLHMKALLNILSHNHTIK